HTLPGLAEDAHLTPPTLIIVGEVVKLHENLAWFEPVLDAENAPANILALDPETKQPLE
ncbi:MAG: siroheme synthase, partial [Nitrosomonas sp.]